MAILIDRDLLDVLSDINFRMTHHGGKLECNPLERYSFLVKHSEHGKACSYAAKYRDYFLDHDYETIRNLILEAADLIRSIEPGEKPPISFSSHPDD